MTRHWHWQTTTIISETTRQSTVSRGQHVIISRRSLCGSSLSGCTFTVSCRLTFSCNTIRFSLTSNLIGTCLSCICLCFRLCHSILSSCFLLFCLANGTLTGCSTFLLGCFLTGFLSGSTGCSTSSSLLTRTFGCCCSSTSLSFSLLLTCFSFCDTTCILPSSRLCSRFLACNLLRTLLCCSSTGGSLRTSFSYCTGTSLLYFNLNESVNLCIQRLLLLSALCYHTLKNLLILLQSSNNILLFYTLMLHLSMYYTVFIKQVTLVTTYLLQLIMLLIHLTLFSLQLLSLCPLISSILTNETQTTIHLRQTLCRKHEHQLVLDATMARHITHGTDKTRTTLTELSL